MKLADTGKLVIFTPLLCQLVFSSVLIFLLFQAQDLSSRSARSTEVVSACNSLLRQMLDDTILVSGGSAADSMMNSQTLQSHIDEMRATLRLIERKVRARGQDQTDKINRMNLTFDAAVSLMNTSYLQMSRGGQAKSVGTFRWEHEGRPLVRDLSTTLSEIMDAATADDQIDAANIEWQKEQIRNWLIWAGAGGVSISAILALLCAIYLYRRIQVITQNTARFAQRKQLREPLGGSDELALLDKDFHAMDRSVEEAAQSGRALIDNAGALVCSLSGEGYFRTANSFAQRLLGMSPDELIGRSLLDIVVKEDCLVADEVLGTASANEATRSCEMRLADSGKQPVDTSWSTFWSQEDGSLFCVVSDITERKNVQRLKDDFINMISHDLRTPLMSLNVDIALMTRSAEKLPADAVAELAAAERTVEQLIRLVNDLLDFEKLNAGKMPFEKEELSAGALIQELIEKLEDKILLSDVELDMEHIADLRINADRERLLQALENCLLTALRATAPGGKVAIRTSADEQLEIGFFCSTASINEGLFEAFAPSPRDNQKMDVGTGLELALSKLILQGHNGSLKAEKWNINGAKLGLNLPEAK
jgi:PAS domain S-box-containing protein